MRKLTVLLVLIPFLSSLAQITFQKNYGTYLHEQAHAVMQTSDGGYILVGDQSTGGMNPDIYMSSEILAGLASMREPILQWPAPCWRLRMDFWWQVLMWLPSHRDALISS